MRKNSYLIILIFIFSCGTEKKHSVENICECYSESDLDKLSNFDSKLEDCLIDFNNMLNSSDLDMSQKELEQFYLNEIFNLTKSLIKSCPAYQNDFDELFLNRYSKSNKNNLDNKIDSISNRIYLDKHNTADLINLAEYMILKNDLNSALVLANQSISIDSKNENGYFVRSFIYHKKGQFEKSIEDYIQLKKITDDSNRKKISELMILNLNQQLK